MMVDRPEDSGGLTALYAQRGELRTERDTLRDLDYLIDDVVADAYVRGVEGRDTETSPQSAKTLHDAIAAALSARPQPPQQPVAVDGLVRPIVGIENRTPQEVFDIMADRIRSALYAAPLAQPVAWQGLLGDELEQRVVALAGHAEGEELSPERKLIADLWEIACGLEKRINAAQPVATAGEREAGAQIAIAAEMEIDEARESGFMAGRQAAWETVNRMAHAGRKNLVYRTDALLAILALRPPGEADR